MIMTLKWYKKVEDDCRHPLVDIYYNFTRGMGHQGDDMNLTS